jgi:hypothetical protein
MPICTIDGQGTLVLSAVPLGGGSDAGSVSVDVTVSTTSSMVFHQTKMATVTSSEPNGPGCGVCTSADASFSPP